jgi:hypothetical protein
MSNDPNAPLPADLPYARPYPMHYAALTLPGRPGILTAVAILDLVLASLAMPCNFSQMMMTNIVSRFVTINRHATLVTPPGAPTPAGEFIAPNGLSASQRQLVLDALARARPVSAARREQLDAILADTGRQIIHLSPEYLTAERLDSYVTETRSGPAGDVFVLGSGTLTVDDHSATFTAQEDGSSISVRDGNCIDPSGTHLGALQIASVIDRVRKLSNNKLTSAQSARLATELRIPGQGLITSNAPATQVVSAQIQPDGSIAITTTGGSFTASANGSQYSSSTGIGSNFSYTSSSTTAGTNGSPFPGVSRSAVVLLGLDALAGVVFAIALLVLGILLLKNWQRSRQFHLIYAVGKLLLLPITMWAVWQLNSSRSTLWLLVGAVYPIALLIVMNTPTVRQYFAVKPIGQVY